MKSLKNTGNWLRGAGIAAVLSISVAIAPTLAQTTAAPTQAAPAGAAVIPPAEIIAKSSEATTILAALAHKFAPSGEIEGIKRSVPGLAQQIDLDFTDTSAMLGDQPTLEPLKVQHALWQRWHQKISSELAQLTQRAAALREALDRLANLRETWAHTRDHAQSQGAPASIRQRIEASLTAIEAMQSQLKLQEEEALGLQGELARELARCNEILEYVSKAQKSAVEGLFAKENPPIWSAELWDHALSALPRSMQVISRGFWLNLLKYLQDPSRGDAAARGTVRGFSGSSLRHSAPIPPVDARRCRRGLRRQRVRPAIFRSADDRLDCRHRRALTNPGARKRRFLGVDACADVQADAPRN